MNNFIAKAILISVVLLGTACTRMPAEYRQSTVAGESSLPVFDQRKMALLVSADIGVPTNYTDQLTGVSSELLVQAEYFSANGRVCRRYIERVLPSAQAHKGLACNDARAGWIDIPVSSFKG